MATAPRLDPEVVALVLQHVSLQQRMRSCALVCSDWRAGAALATQQVAIHSCTQAKVDALAAWLHSNASYIGNTTALELKRPRKLKGRPCPAAPWSSIPWESLTGLQHVCISGIMAAPAAAGAQGAPHAAAAAVAAPVPAVLQGLTSLEVALDGLSFLGVVDTPTLRKLVCCADPSRGKMQTEAIAAACTALKRAFPQLQRLTSLTLRGRVCDSKVLAATSCLTALRHLELHSMVKPCRGVGGIYVKSFASFPASLTSLDIDLKGVHNIRPQDMCQLTALQELKLQHQGSITASVLSGKGGLRKLVLGGSDLLEAAGQSLGLQPFSELTKLQHLELAVACAGANAMTAAHAAYLTASSHLTSLQLHQDMLTWPSQAFTTMFTDRQLPDLQDLTIGPKLLCNESAMQHMVHSCPKLRQLMITSMQQQGDVELHQADALLVQPDVLSQSLGALAALTGLQELQLPLVDPPLSKEGWAALAACSRLERLDVVLDARSPLEVMHGMTKLRQLTQLEVRAFFQEDVRSITCTYKDSAKSGLQALDHSPSDVWWQTPVQMMQVLSDEFNASRCMMHCDGWPTDEVMNAAKSAAQQIVQELEDELAQVPQQLPQQQHQQQQHQEQQQATSNASQGQLEQPDGLHGMLVKAIRGLKDSLAAMEKEVKEWEESNLHSIESEEEFEREEKRRRREWRDAQPVFWM